MTATARIRGFLAAACDRVAQHDSAIARQVAHALASPLVGAPALAPTAMPACESLPRLLADPQDDLVRALAVCAGDLHWRLPGFGNLPGEISRKLAVTEIIGPDGMFPRPDLRVGLLIQGPGLHYPRHSHAAEELYLVLKGTANWTVDDAALVSRGPGSVILHKPLQPHSMVTGQTAMLALWGWTGDIAGSSYSL